MYKPVNRSIHRRLDFILTTQRQIYPKQGVHNVEVLSKREENNSLATNTLFRVY
jgi:hypothetical protein